MNGVDYAWGRPGGQAIKNQGYQFVCRYLSPDGTKNLDKNERDDLLNNGLSIVLVWESTSGRALGGYIAGADDARSAVKQANALGLPNSCPIYFAVDFDASESQQAAINAYMQGASSVIGLSRTGVYGGFYVVKRCLDAGVVKWAWQTAAWGGGQKDSRAHIFQNAITIPLNGVQCDVNQALKNNFGQWTKGGDMAELANLKTKQILFYYIGGRRGFSLTGDPKDKTKNALAGETDTDLNGNHAKDELSNEYIQALAASQESVGNEQKFQRMISDLNALRAGARLDTTKQQALDSAIKLLQGLKG